MDAGGGGLKGVDYCREVREDEGAGENGGAPEASSKSRSHGVRLRRAGLSSSLVRRCSCVCVAGYRPSRKQALLALRVGRCSVRKAALSSSRQRLGS